VGGASISVDRGSHTALFLVGGNLCLDLAFVFSGSLCSDTVLPNPLLSTFGFLNLLLNYLSFALQSKCERKRRLESSTFVLSAPHRGIQFKFTAALSYPTTSPRYK
jgi:hypothetical protein